MRGQVIAIPTEPKIIIKHVLVTPELAIGLLEHNKINRPLTDAHVKRIARQISSGKWRFNGDTIKLCDDGGIVDGQHRLWAIIEAKKAVDTIIVYGVPSDAFSTVDTLRKPRSGSDILAVRGVERHTRYTASALTWLVRYQAGNIVGYRKPSSRVENSDIEDANRKHPHMGDAIDLAMKMRGLVNPSILGFFYYVLYSRNEVLADRMMAVLETPAGTSMNDPFYRLREWLLAVLAKEKHRDPIATIGLLIRMSNAAAAKKQVKAPISWRTLNQAAEKFPTLDV